MGAHWFTRTQLAGKMWIGSSARGCWDWNNVSHEKFWPENVELLPLIFLIVNHLQYSPILLNGISQSLIEIPEKNWLEHSRHVLSDKKVWASDLPIKHDTSAVRICLVSKAKYYFWKSKNNLLPALLQVGIEITKKSNQKRTQHLVYNYSTYTKFMIDRFFKTVESWRMNTCRMNWKNLKKGLSSANKGRSSREPWNRMWNSTTTKPKKICSESRFGTPVTSQWNSVFFLFLAL